MKLDTKLLLASLAAPMAATPVQAQVLSNFDGTDAVMREDDEVLYSDLAGEGLTATQWTERDNANDGLDFLIQNGQLEQNDRDNSSVRTGAVFSVDLSGLVAGNIWVVEFDLVNGGTPAGGINDVDIFVGEDDGDNTTERVFQHKGGVGLGQTNSDIVVGEWNHVFEDGWALAEDAGNGSTVQLIFGYDGSQSTSYDAGVKGVQEDLSSKDLLAIQFQSDGLGANFLKIDNLELKQVDVDTLNGARALTLGDYDKDGDWEISEVDQLTAAADLTALVATVGPDAALDINANNFGSTTRALLLSDLHAWLYYAAKDQGFNTAFRNSDADLDRDVDSTDFFNLAGNYNPTDSGAVFSDGDTNGNGTVDSTDFFALAGDYSPTGYASQAPLALSLALAAPGEINLYVDVNTGEVWMDANGASVSLIEVQSASGGLVDLDDTPEYLGIVLTSTTTAYTEANFPPTNTTLLDGDMLSLGVLYDTAQGASDLVFLYGTDSAIPGQVFYVPEPTSLALLGLGGLMIARRRRG